MRQQGTWQMAVWANPVNGAGVRVGDAEREQAARALGEHFAVGRLDREEHDERVDAAYAARTRADLAALFRDLPQPRPGQLTAPVRRPVARHHSHRVPFLPVLLILIGLAIILEAGWLVLIGVGGFFLLRKSGFGSRRPQRSGLLH